MAYEGTKLTWTFVAGADLSAAANQYKFVKLDGSNAGQVVLCGDGEDAIGVLQDTPSLGDVCEVVLWGITKVYAGASYNAGVVLSSGASGVANTSANGDYMLGKALESGANGVISTMLFAPYGIDPS